MEFSRQEYWSGLPFPSPGDLANLGIKPRSPTLQADALPSEPPGKPIVWICHILFIYASVDGHLGHPLIWTVIDSFIQVFVWIHIYSIYIWLTPKNKDTLPLYFKNVIMYCNTLPLGNSWCMEKLPEAPGLTSGNSSNCYIHADVKLKRWKELTLQVLCLWHIHLDSTSHMLRSGS